MTGNGGDKRFGAEVSFNLEVGVKVADKFRVAMAAENIFNNYPDAWSFGVLGGF